MTLPVLQVGTVDRVQQAAVQIVGLEVAAAAVAALVAVAYRRRTTAPLPSGTGAFLGLSTVGAWLLVELVTGDSLLATLPLAHYGTAVYGLTAVGLGAALGTAGRHLGDRIACEAYGIERLETEGHVADRLRSARSLVALDLPETVADARGFLPVDAETERALAGARFRMPSRLTPAEIEDRVESRIVTDYDVDHASVTFEDGAITSLSIGRRRHGLGPTLPPGTVAVAIHADPAPDASPGDPVEVWATDAADHRLVAKGQFRASAGDVTTVVLDEDDATAFDPGSRYRLVTPPASTTDNHRLVSLLRGVDETTVALSVDDGSALEGEFVGWLPGAVLAIERDDDVLALPDDRMTLEETDTVFLVGRPTALATSEADLRSTGTATGQPSSGSARRTAARDAD